MILKVKDENGQFKEVVLKGLKGERGERGERGEDGTVLQQKEIDDIKSSLDSIETQKANKSDLETLEVRMNNFTSLPNGSTTGDAELIDARVGTQGEIYDNIGEAIRRQTNILNNNEYWKLPIAYYSGGINNSGNDSSNTSNMNTNARSTYIHVSKGDILKVKDYCIVLFEYSGDYTFKKYTRYENEINLVFNEDKILKFYLYNKDGSNMNSTSTVGTFLNLQEQKNIDNSVSLLYVNKKDRFCYGRYVDNRINYNGDKKTIFALPRQLKNNTSIYVNGNHKINLASIIDGEINSSYGFGGASLVKTVTDGLYMMFVQKQDETPINSFDNFDIELDIIENYKNKYVDGFTKLAYHRGFSSMRAENTISAFEYVAQYGGKYVECDVEETSDGNLVILHDSTVDRTTNGTGDIRTLTLAQVKDLYVDAPMFIALYNNTLRIPTFDEFLINCRKNNLTPIIEIKRAVNFTTLVNAIIKYGFENNCIVQSSDISHLLSIRTLNKNLYLCLLAETYKTSVLNSFTRLGKNAGVSMHINATSTTYIKRFQDLNGFFGSYVSDDYTEMERLSEWGCDFILTNRLLNNGNNLYNFKVENLYYSSEGKAIDYTIPYNETSLFSDVIHITAQVYCDTNALLTIGDKTLTIRKTKEWNYIDLKFIQKVSGNINIKLECNDENFRHILFKVKRYCGDLI